MKKLIERYSGGILTAAVILLFAVCSLSVWIYADFRADTAAVQSQTYLHQTLLKTNLRRLDAALTEENRMTAYHFAMTAADHAASAGLGTDAVFFRKISAGITEGAENLTDIAEAVRGYLETGTVPETFVLQYETAGLPEEGGEWEPTSVSYARERAARECAVSMTGVSGILRAAEQHPAGEYVYTCRNAYAVVDARSGTPLEAGISSPVTGEVRLSESDCAERAYSFLGEYFRADTVRRANIISAVPDNATGTYEFTYQSGDRTIRLTVKRDT
ncbi:MAG: hypothetical protein J6D10_13765, partial [Clostridia bacterium]|nr:hypothetical protein [Clostridia bacterium]